MSKLIRPPKEEAESPTVRMVRSFQLAGEDQEILFGRLEGFANLGDSLEEFLQFRIAYPSFAPLADLPGGLFPGDPKRDQKLHPHILGYRDCVRDLWRGCDGPERPRRATIALAFLLNITQQTSTPWDTVGEYFKSHGLDTFYSGGTTSLIPDWWNCRLSYRTESEFCRAVFLLWQENWRARVCHWCSKYFIAGKPAQLYCSTKCCGEAKKRRDLDWWKAQGSQRRKSRSRKRQRKGE